MILKLKNKLKEKTGAMFIDLSIIMLVLFIILIFTVNFLPVFAIKSNLNTFVNDLTRTVEVYGQVDTESRAREEKLRQELGINPIVEYSKTGKIQLDEEFTITVRQDYSVKMSNLFNYTLPIRSKGVGVSEVYWK